MTVCTTGSTTSVLENLRLAQLEDAKRILSVVNCCPCISLRVVPLREGGNVSLGRIQSGRITYAVHQLA